MLKELLHNIKRYQRAKNERNSINIENLGTQLPEEIQKTDNLIPKLFIPIKIYLLSVLK